MSPAHIDFDEVGALGEEPSEEIKGSGPGEGDEEVEIDLVDELGSLLVSLNAWREKVAVEELPEIPGLSRFIELKLLDLLTSQLDCELFSPNMTVAGLRKRVDGVLQKGCELLVVSASLREKKVELEEKLLSRLLELQKALEVSDLQKKLALAQSEISSRTD